MDRPKLALIRTRRFVLYYLESVASKAGQIDNMRDLYKGCMIKLADGRELGGKTFFWNAGKELMKEGNFDLKDWQIEQLEK